MRAAVALGLCVLALGCEGIRQYAGGIDAGDVPTVGDGATDAGDAADAVDASADVVLMDTGTDVGTDVGPSDTGPVCATGQTLCGSACVNTATDIGNCGTCSHVCSLANAVAACTAGNCSIGTCSAGYADCNSNPADGCETNLNTTVSSCGACGTTCSLANATPACAAGVCAIGVCNTGYGDCDGLAANGCEAVLNTSTNCGACGMSCMAGTHCSSGTCVSSCPTGTTFCSLTDVCATTMTDVGNCGSCGNACAAPANASATCASGTCGFACNMGFGDCNPMASDGCETNLGSSVANCGACGHACTAPTGGSASCTGSVCSSSCPTGMTNCGGVCQTIGVVCTTTGSGGCQQTGMTVCSGAGTACSVTAPRTTGACMAPAGGACDSTGTCVCGGATPNNCAGTCTSTVSDSANCGACGHVCVAPTGGIAGCSGSACVTGCPSGMTNCGGVCQTIGGVCSTMGSGGCQQTGTIVCSGSSAVCSVTSPRTTGACMAPAGGSCDGTGTCVCTGATPNNCAGMCTSTMNDSANCGSCGHVCSAPTGGSASCSGAVCSSSCPTGMTNCGGVCQTTGAACATTGSGGCQQSGTMVCSGTSTACSVTSPRTSGTCTSPAGGTCDGTGTCVCAGATPSSCGGTCTNTATDAANCGACGNVCSAPTGGSASCSGAVCSSSCPTGMTNCGGACQTIGTTCTTTGSGGCQQTGTTVCSGTGTACSVTAPRTSGVCTAPSGGSCDGTGSCVCGGATPTNCGGTCSNTMTDIANCGGCGTACPSGAGCFSGVCSAELVVSAGHTARLQVDASEGWETVRSAAASIYTDDGARAVGSYGYPASTGQSFSNARLSLVFPALTGLPPGASIVAARIEVLPLNVVNVPVQTLRINSFSPGTAGTIVASDYALSHWGATSFGEEPLGNFVVGTRHSIAFNTAGIIALSNPGGTSLGLRTNFDMDDGTPSNRASGTSPGMIIDPEGSGPETARLIVDYILVPRPIAPLSTATVTSTRPTLHWQLAPGTDGARVQICRDRACTTVEQTLDVTGSSGAPTPDLSPGVHFWRLFRRTGTTVGVTPSPTWELFVGHRSAPIDSSWGSVADFNGDGYADLVVGAPDNWGTTGSAYVYNGAASGISTTPSLTLTAPAGSVASFGYPVSSAGDVNGDGYADLIVGSFDQSRSGPGHAYVYLGSATGLPTTPSVTLSAPGTTTFGWSVTSAGDVNGDGYADVAVGQYFHDGVWVFLGGPAAVPATPSLTLTSPESGDSFGFAVGAGDVNGDGFGDLVVAAPGATSTTGGTYVYYGGTGGLPTTPSVSLPVLFSEGGATRVASAGDVNSDGYADLLVVAGSHSYLYPGSSTGISVTPSLTLEVPGKSVGSAGDLNGDGYADFAVGVIPYSEVGTGYADVFLGSATGPSTTPGPMLTDPGGANTGFGVSVTGGGDLNGDGYTDLVVGADASGRVFIYLGSSSGVSTTPSVILVSPGGTSFGHSVANAASQSPFG